MKTYKYIAVLKLKAEFIEENNVKENLVTTIRSNKLANIKSSISSWTNNRGVWDLYALLEDGVYINL